MEQTYTFFCGRQAFVIYTAVSMCKCICVHRCQCPHEYLKAKVRWELSAPPHSCTGSATAANLFYWWTPEQVIGCIFLQHVYLMFNISIWLLAAQHFCPHHLHTAYECIWYCIFRKHFHTLFPACGYEGLYLDIVCSWSMLCVYWAGVNVVLKQYRYRHAHTPRSVNATATAFNMSSQTSHRSTIEMASTCGKGPIKCVCVHGRERDL